MSKYLTTVKKNCVYNRNVYVCVHVIVKETQQPVIH